VKDYIIVLSLEFRLRIRLADEFAWDKNIKVREVLFGKLHDTPSPSFSSCDTEPHSPSLCALHPLPLFCFTHAATATPRNLDFSSTQLEIPLIQPSPTNKRTFGTNMGTNSKAFATFLVGLGGKLKNEHMPRYGHAIHLLFASISYKLG